MAQPGSNDMRRRGGDAAVAVPEAELDALLAKVEEKRQAKPHEQVEEPPDVIEIFRNRLRQVYRPVFQELHQKYAAKGLTLEMDADEFLGGGTALRFHFTYGDLAMELDGTVMRGGVAFYIVRSVGQTQGAVVSGPLLRIRNLSPDDFRRFIVDHLSQLIRDALRRA